MTVTYGVIPSTDPERVSAQQLPRSTTKIRRLIIATIVCIAGTVFLGAFIVYVTKPKTVTKRNVILMISDGFGPASETFARQYDGWRKGLLPKALLPLDSIHVGHSRTQSASSLVTDSAAGATAFACGLKTYNGAIGVDPERIPCGTVLEAAKLNGMLTGLVATSRVTDATPASFSVHVIGREMETIIAEQQIGYHPLGRTIDLMFGGGQCMFMPNTTAGSCRMDDRNLLQEAHDHFGWNVQTVASKQDATATSNKLPLMSFHALDHMPYEIDREPSTTPSLSEMAGKALELLSKASEETHHGFFLVIEGSRIDMAAHTHDSASHFYEIYEYHQTAELVKQFVDEHPNTVLIATSDHETGGLTVGRQVGPAYPEYTWNPDVIQRVQNSSETLARLWNNKVKDDGPDQAFLEQIILHHGLGIEDATKDEIEQLMAWKWDKSIFNLESALAEMVSRRALVGFTTHGHTAVDVNLYAYGAGTEALRGSHENTEISDFIAKYLHLDRHAVTKRLKSIRADWMTEIHQRMPHYPLSYYH